MPESSSFMYHEKQLASLCGAHALNNLLQGPHFGAGDLAELAHRLDDDERALLSRTGLQDARRVESNRVDQLTGDFNIEVLSEALKAHGFELVSADHAAVAERVLTSAQDEDAFLLHVRAHWFALRKVGGMWWNVDSRLERPRLVPHEALSAGLAAVRAQGQTVYLVRHAIHSGPPAPPLRHTGSFSAGREDVWHPLDYLLSRDEVPLREPLDHIFAGERVHDAPKTSNPQREPNSSHRVAFEMAPSANGPPAVTQRDRHMRTLNVTVPPNARAGHPMLVRTPEGTMVQTKVPAGLAPGDTFTMQTPLPRTAAHPPCLLRGYLRKRPVTSSFGRSHDRYIVLLSDRLRWHTDHYEAPVAVLGEMLLTADTAVELKDGGSSLLVTSRHGTLHLQPPATPQPQGAAPLAQWAQAIVDAVNALYMPRQAPAAEQSAAMPTRATPADEEEEQLRLALALSSQEAQTQRPRQSTGGEELRLALALSLQEATAAGDGRCATGAGAASSSADAPGVGATRAAALAPPPPAFEEALRLPAQVPMSSSLAPPPPFAPPPLAPPPPPLAPAPEAATNRPPPTFEEAMALPSRGTAPARTSEIDPFPSVQVK